MKLLIDEALDQYVHDHTKPRPPLFDELREATYAQMEQPQMQVGRVEGGFLKMLVQLCQAKRVLEIGMFTGYSALCMAEGLDEDGRLVTCDVDAEVAAMAKQFFARSPHGKKIEVVLGPALQTLESLPKDPPFDMAFIDADKTNYLAYFEAILPRLRTGGLIVADNTLWSGSVLAPETESAKAICTFNDAVQADDRVENVLLSVRDGMMLARKR